jgi:hypothetical protein
MLQIDSHLIADVALSAVEIALQDWQWLCPDVSNLILMSAVGDVFFEDSQGQVNRLDSGVGSIHPIARSRVAFEECAGVDFSILCRIFQQGCRVRACGAANTGVATRAALVRHTPVFAD